MEKKVNQAILLCKSVINQTFYQKNAKLADNIAIYGITVLTKKSIIANTFEEKYLDITKYWYTLQP